MCTSACVCMKKAGEKNNNEGKSQHGRKTVNLLLTSRTRIQYL